MLVCTALQKHIVTDLASQNLQINMVKPIDSLSIQLQLTAERLLEAVSEH